MLSEKEYYQTVKDYIADKFHCIGTSVNKGHLALGLVDVVGVYDTSCEHYNDAEVILVEVKTTTDSFGKSLGQALGYSIFGERCYLSVTFYGDDTFTKEQEYIANHLGVGLIRVPVDSNGRPRRAKIEIVLSSKKYEPIQSQKHNMLAAIGIGTCCICGIFSSRKEMHQLSSNAEHPALFAAHYKRTFSFCEKCYHDIIPEEKRQKRANMLLAGQKAILTRKRRAAGQKAARTKEQNANKELNENIS
jgi:hypothetical protein